ncbi:MAG: hypothetical protein IJ437_05340 [Clostridia bacterium]|nr:hypothetical protein [Clostridia bacterium]
MKYQTPIYEKNVVETNDVMTVSSEADVNVEQENDITNAGVAFNQLFNKYFG